jgi:hypothetical protein
MVSRKYVVITGGVNWRAFALAVLKLLFTNPPCLLIFELFTRLASYINTRPFLFITIQLSWFVL